MAKPRWSVSHERETLDAPPAVLLTIGGKTYRLSPRQADDFSKALLTAADSSRNAVVPIPGSADKVRVEPA